MGVREPSTGQMRDHCRSYIRIQDKAVVSTNDARDASYCMGFISGLSIAWAMWSPDEFAAGVTGDQITRVFVQWADQHPELANKPFAVEFMFAEAALLVPKKH